MASGTVLIVVAMSRADRRKLRRTCQLLARRLERPPLPRGADRHAVKGFGRSALQVTPFDLDRFDQLAQLGHADDVSAEELRAIARLLERLADAEQSVTRESVIAVAMPPPPDRVAIAPNAINAPPRLLAID
jgi:hypothetical protein